MAKLLQPGTRVAWIGDSHSEALGPLMAQLLPQHTGAQFVRSPEARRGWSVRRYVRSGDVPALSRGAEVVVVELGGNDASAGIGPSAHAQDVQQMIQQIGADKKVIWIGPGVTLREDIEAVRGPIRAAQRRAVEATGNVWVDAQPLTRTDELAGDRVHFRMTGYRNWARRMLPVLAAAGTAVGVAWLGPVALGLAGLFAVGAWWWSRRR